MSFSDQGLRIVSHWSLTASKSPRIFRTLHSIHGDFNNAVVWIVSTCPLISKYSCPFTNPLGDRFESSNCCYYNYLLIESFSHQFWLIVFHWSLSDSKFPQVSRTLLSILAFLNNAIVWIVSTRPPTSKSSSPFSNHLVTIPNAPITIGIIVTCMFHSFFNSLTRLRYLSFFSHSFSFILWSAGTAKSTILQFLSFFFC